MVSPPDDATYDGLNGAGENWAWSRPFPAARSRGLAMGPDPAKERASTSTLSRKAVSKVVP